MGFDLAGNRGTEFRKNCWWWRMLWQFTCKVCDLPEEIERQGQYNDGFEIDEAEAERITSILTALIQSGAVKKFEKEYAESLKAMPDVGCDLCKGSGERHDKIVDGKCNKCDGKGKVRPWQTHYPFSEENVIAFRDFVKTSGGFRIY